MVTKQSAERGGRTTIYDVAERAGVSAKTVARVINREKHVGKKNQREGPGCSRGDELSAQHGGKAPWVEG